MPKQVACVADICHLDSAPLDESAWAVTKFKATAGRVSFWSPLELPFAFRCTPYYTTLWIGLLGTLKRTHMRNGQQCCWGAVEIDTDLEIPLF